MDIIKQYYNQVSVPPLVLNNRLKMFERNEDIKTEFEYWITHNQYKKDDCVLVEGYTAESISHLSKYLIGEGSFVLLIELRENPVKAKRRLAEGFMMI